MTLPRDYAEAWEIEVIILDICTEVCRRARQKKLIGSVVSVGVAALILIIQWDFIVK
ncbi:hypothetical protein MNQ98_10795 [Paenibacillus sp. N3/727]|uniref:DinB/UmuC family translesion DNA polymerase n=1 Tax=Paenibacillus sp. N3/727 TaxID=2925845 RepID=UPI001F537BDA|nr:hypothetical protein [Paenibacillus sp. N3/727]UNK21248.1 hypothetical protein MNQ98_10795 [Paenibacillus sp. N3/727]